MVGESGMIERTYKCDLCLDRIEAVHPPKFGIFHTGSGGWIMSTDRSIEHHLCANCISSIQLMHKVCGQGYECGGGPMCSSDHK